MSKIIVTVSDAKRSFSYDMELPTDVEAEKLQSDICEVLTHYHPELQKRLMEKRMFIYNRDAYIDSRMTLDSSGVETGDIILFV